jgi:hypothetical protein
MALSKTYMDIFFSYLNIIINRNIMQVQAMLI